MEASAGGAALEEVVISAIAGVLFLIGCAGVVWSRRRGRFGGLDRVADAVGRHLRLPGWAALPLAVAGVSLVIAVFGFYWDVATHIDHGRDEGVFGNAAHWPILVGLVGIAVAGLFAIVLGDDEPRPGSFELRPGWHVSIGGGLLLLCGSLALLGFPIDDVWHRIFGQDVTLWSPPHIQMVAGASLCTIAMWILFVEAERSSGAAPRSRRHRVQEIGLAGAVLIGLSTLQGEFDFGVPQFRLLFQPVLIAIAAGIALVPARLRLGRGGALLAVGFFLALRGVTSLVVSGVFEHVTFHLPLYLGAALVVEVVAARVPEDRQLRIGALSGLGIGTVGLAAEAVWTQVAMPIPWTATMLPEAAVVAIPAAVAAGVAGGFLARALVRPGVPQQPAPTPALAPLSLVVLVAALAWPLPTTGVDAEATLTLEPVAGATPGEHAQVTVEVDPPSVVDDPEWLHVIAWQGAAWWSEEATDLQELTPLERVEDGTYRTTTPVPIDGEWKAMVRLHDGRVMAAVPIFLPEDPAIPADEVPAEPEVTRAFVPDHEILLREMRPAPGWVTLGANLLMVAIAAGWLAAFVLGTRRLRRSAGVAGPVGAADLSERR
ncbi:hypothetical protein FTX61_08235 [Nitriliruptoraceae bacterium ZYF776]|nr:hypothetical protein [Profundirhabdus halotolerans]